MRTLLAGLVAFASLGVVGYALLVPAPTPPAWEPAVELQTAATVVEPVSAIIPAPPEKPLVSAVPSFRRGVNMSRPLSFAARDPVREGKYLWPPFQGDLAIATNSELDRLRNLGFDFVRLPVDVGPFLEADETQARELFETMRQWVLRFRGHGLAVLLDIHPATYASHWRPEDILADPAGAKFGRYSDFLYSVAALFKDQPSDGFALELMNEPQPACERTDGEDWTASQKRLYDKVRAAAPAMPVVLTGGCWSSVDGLTRLDPAAYDAATLYDFHYYEPYYFTHQSIVWASPPAGYLAGLSYPASSGSLEKTLGLSQAHLMRLAERGSPQPADAFAAAKKQALDYYGRQKPGPDKMAARFDEVTAWAKSNGVAAGRIVMGEFGAIRWPDGVEDDGSRLRWLSDARKAAEDHGFGWALWDYNEGFGLLSDNGSRTVDTGTASALGLDLNALAR